MPIAKCKCNNDYQDQLYGKGKRVHNLCKKGEAMRCTVCLDVKVTGAAQ